MIKRKIEKELEDFHHDVSHKALLLTGARQVGKTFSVREFARTHYESFVEFNFIKDKKASAIFKNVSDERDILLRISALTATPLRPGKTLIFFDEVQVCPEAITYVKFLVEEGSCRYILSGSLLGVELKNIRSVPVGYMTEVQMYPVDFEEFVRAVGGADGVIDYLRDAFLRKNTPDLVIHQRMLRYHQLYLITGGMPAVVQKYIECNDLREVYSEQKSIVREYVRDVTQYDEHLKMRLRYIYSLIPSELNKHNKRFYIKNVSSRGRFDRNEADFIWLKEAGIALPVYNVDEPKIPLELARKSNLFKLFMNDVGLLCSSYMDGIQLKILNDEVDVNLGAVYENYVAQELAAHGFNTLFYYNSTKRGEVDFLVEYKGRVLPIEVKSGKDYMAHAALNNLMATDEFALTNAYVLSREQTVKTEGKITYFPIYFLMFLTNEPFLEPMLYRVD